MKIVTNIQIMKKTYSVSETAKILGYSTNSIYGFLKEGLINSVRIGKGKFRIPEKEIEKFEGNKGEKKRSNRKKYLRRIRMFFYPVHYYHHQDQERACRT